MPKVDKIHKNYEVHVRYSSNAEQVFATGTDTEVSFEDVEYDALSACSHTPWEFTAPYPGKYLVTAQVTFASTGGWDAGEEIEIQLRLNGATTSITTNGHSGNINDQDATYMTTIVTLVAGDKLKVRAMQRVGANLALTAGASQNWVQVSRIGD